MKTYCFQKGVLSMRNDQHRISAMKKQLFEKKKQGVKSVYWKLSTRQQVEEIGRIYPLIPYLTEIHTRQFADVRNLPPLLKEIHYSYKKGKRTIVRRLRRGEAKLLVEYRVWNRPIRYEIKLNYWSPLGLTRFMVGLSFCKNFT